jgi:hypothetical protein
MLGQGQRGDRQDWRYCSLPFDLSHAPGNPNISHD